MPRKTKPPRQEFERKFLVRMPSLPTDLPAPQHIVQGYVHLDLPHVRVRVTDKSAAVVEIKGEDRFESSKLPISLSEAWHLLDRYAARAGRLITKLRYVVPSAFPGLKWEIDLFQDENEPLAIVEIETPDEGYPLDRKLFPPWVGREVTEDPRFKNRNLAIRPFRAWHRKARREILSLMGKK